MRNKTERSKSGITVHKGGPRERTAAPSISAPGISKVATARSVVTFLRSCLRSWPSNKERVRPSHRKLAVPNLWPHRDYSTALTPDDGTDPVVSAPPARDASIFNGDAVGRRPSEVRTAGGARRAVKSQ